MKRSRLFIRVVPALVAGTTLLGPQVAGAQQAPPAQQLPSVAVTPLGATSSDPNNGQWFVAAASPGQTLRLLAHVFNPADVPQTVATYLADVDYRLGGGAPKFTPHAEAHDVGAWGGFDNPTLTVPAKGFVDVPFSVTVPSGADPGDHLGAVIAESAPQPGTGASAAFRVIKRVAVRLYVTVPGETPVPISSVESQAGGFPVVYEAEPDEPPRAGPAYPAAERGPSGQKGRRSKS